MARRFLQEIQFFEADSPQLRTQKLRTLADELRRLGQQLTTTTAVTPVDLSGIEFFLQSASASAPAGVVLSATAPITLAGGVLGLSIGTGLAIVGDELVATGGGGGGVTDHGALTGLGDDDHTQYLLRSILTTDGDLMIQSGGVATRLPVGGGTQILGVSGGLPAWVAAPSGSLVDGDYGDITISGGVTAFTIDNDAVTFVKMQNIATARLLGRNTAGSGDIEELSAATAKALLAITLDELTDVAITTPATGAVLLYNGSLWVDDPLLGIGTLTDPGADRLLFWDDSANSVAWLTLGTNLSITGTTLNASGGGGGGGGYPAQLGHAGL